MVTHPELQNGWDESSGIRDVVLYIPGERYHDVERREAPRLLGISLAFLCLGSLAAFVVVRADAGRGAPRLDNRAGDERPPRLRRRRQPPVRGRRRAGAGQPAAALPARDRPVARDRASPSSAGRWSSSSAIRGGGSGAPARTPAATGRRPSPTRTSTRTGTTRSPTSTRRRSSSWSRRSPRLPWQAFVAAWTAILLAAVRFLTGPRLLAAGLLFPFTRWRSPAATSRSSSRRRSSSGSAGRGPGRSSC